jgi:hypothetical protein
MFNFWDGRNARTKQRLSRRYGTPSAQLSAVAILFRPKAEGDSVMKKVTIRECPV